MSYYDGRITEKAFYDIVSRVGNDFKRLTYLDAEIPNVYGGVRSQSGISDWYFKIDFNDNGKITGRFKIQSDNTDSNIPEEVANRISKGIRAYFIYMDDGHDQNISQQEEWEEVEDSEQCDQKEWEEVEDSEQCDQIEHRQTKDSHSLIIIFGSMGILLAMLFFMFFFGNLGLERHEQELQDTVDEIMIDIDNGDFVEARIKANSLYWNDNWSSEGEEKWNAIREEVITQIDEAENKAGLIEKDGQIKGFWRWFKLVIRGM